MRLAKFVTLLSAVSAALFSRAHRAAAFTHVVQKGETLAQIAERTYGRIQYEKVLVAANALDAQGGSPIVAGERLEIPALDHYRVNAGDTWQALAKQLLGDPERSTVFAQANDTMPWIPPADGAEIVVPYNLRYIATQADTIVTVAQKFTGEKEKAWVLDQYNHMKGQPVRRGDVILVPLTSLPLTEAGKAEAAAADVASRSQAAGSAREAQRKVDAEMPLLLGDIRGGRYIDAITRGGKLLALGALTKPQLGLIHRQLTEAYAALDAPGHAAAACAAWRDNDSKARLDPVLLSPKIMTACSRSQP
ncbi:MAG TPA: LysM domain-containing protein, partial [Polyangiaceae bacterium]|nr:LysM domain-containing protein [Polyangiaceae bacterium]